MVECNCTSEMIYQRVGKDQANQSHNCCENYRVPFFSKLQQIFQNILANASTDVYKHDGYEPVPLGGGSVMHIRTEPEAIFREGK